MILPSFYVSKKDDTSGRDAKRERAEAWRVAIGLQARDSLRVSDITNLLRQSRGNKPFIRKIKTTRRWFLILLCKKHAKNIVSSKIICTFAG